MYRRFECMSLECTGVLTVPDSDCGDGFAISCPECGYLHFDGGSVQMFDYHLLDKRTKREISHGPFAPTHRIYLERAARVKYCLLCCTLQPLENFGRHARRVSQRQGECKMCKDLYNGLKNETRLTEQHREAADTRRLLRELSGETRVEDISELLDRFDHCCFNCGTELADHPGQDDGFYLDHTLPVSWLWPLDFGPTVLCRICNSEKGDRWPREFYKEDERILRRLATKTGIPLEWLVGRPTFYPEAIEWMKERPTEIIERWVKYPDKLRSLRTRILGATGEDVFANADPTALKAIGLTGD